MVGEDQSCLEVTDRVFLPVVGISRECFNERKSYVQDQLMPNLYCLLLQSAEHYAVMCSLSALVLMAFLYHVTV